MSKTLRFWLAGALAMSTASVALAQHPFRAASPSFASAPSRTGVPAVRLIPARPSGTPVMVRRATNAANATVSVTTTPNFTVASATTLSLDQLLNPVPGLGFDFVHLAAINHDLGVRAFIDPVTQERLFLAERLLRDSAFVPALFPVFTAPVPAFMPAEQPQVIILQQPATPVVAEPAPAATTSGAATQAAPAPAVTPAPDEGEFILVRRDGSVVFAVGYTQKGDRIIYVTGEGTRRSILRSDLDFAATESMNEVRGVALHLTQ